MRILVLTLLAIAAPVRAEQNVYALLAADVWPTPELGWHGIGLVGWQARDLAGEADLGLALNTDTLIARFDGWCALDGAVCGVAQVKGEYALSGLLPDYYERGVLIEERGIDASHVEATLGAKLTLPGSQFVDLDVRAQRWWFATDSDSYEAPHDTWMVWPRVAYTLWLIESDPSWYEWHRTTRRVRGVGLGVEASIGYRSATGVWGADDGRNEPATWPIAVRQWLRAGWQATDRFRLQLAQSAGWGRGNDDVTRARIGGLNPYVVPVAGVPWAAFVSETWVGAELSPVVRIWDEVEAGPLVHAVWVRDRSRQNRSELAPVVGLGARADARIGPWQLDLSFGWSPDLDWQRDRPHLSLFAGVGRSFAL